MRARRSNVLANVFHHGSVFTGCEAKGTSDEPMPFLKDALKRAGRKAVTESVALLNAARRSSRCAAPLALEVLLRAGSAADIAEGRVPGVDVLRDCRLEVRYEVARCAKTPPRLAGAHSPVDAV